MRLPHFAADAIGRSELFCALVAWQFEDVHMHVNNIAKWHQNSWLQCIVAPLWLLAWATIEPGSINV